MSRILDIYRLQESDSLLFYWMKEILVALVILFAFLVGARLLRYVLGIFAARLTTFISTDLDEKLIQRITPPVTLLVTCTGIYYSLGYLSLPGSIKLVVSGSLFVVNVSIIVNIIYRSADEFLNLYITRSPGRGGSELSRNLLPLVKKVGTIFLAGAGMIVILKHFNYDILSLVTALGIGSLAIGLAAKDTLANMISGFTLMIDRPFHIGDRIQLANGQTGDVVEIGLRSTRIKTLDNALLVIPNSDLCNSTLLNLAFPDTRVKARINLVVAYSTDIEKAKGLLLEIAGELREILLDPKPEVFFASFGESGINIAFFFWVNDYARVLHVTDMINQRILKRFNDNLITIPYPTKTIVLAKDIPASA